MKADRFSIQHNLLEKTELEKVEYLAFYLSELKEESEFTIKDISRLLQALDFARPNATRLTNKVKKSASFIKGTKSTNFKLSAKRKAEIKLLIPNLSENEDVLSDDSVIPEILLQETKRPYLLRLAQQINASYENNLFDACSLIMRRLMEVLLIHAFEYSGIEDAVKDDEGNYQNLKILINKACSRNEVKIANDVAKDMDKFRDLGNLSAHRVKYNCRKDDIRTVKIQYRAIVEELLYAGGLVSNGR